MEIERGGKGSVLRAACRLCFSLCVCSRDPPAAMGNRCLTPMATLRWLAGCCGSQTVLHWLGASVCVDEREGGSVRFGTRSVGYMMPLAGAGGTCACRRGRNGTNGAEAGAAGDPFFALQGRVSM